MKENEFLDGISNIEPDVVERFVSMDNELQKKANKVTSKRTWQRLAAIAACFVLIVSAVIVVPLLKGEGPIIQPPDDPIVNPPDNQGTNPPDDTVVEPPEIPTWDSAQYSAEDIAKLFVGMNVEGVLTNAYTEVVVPDEKYLYIGKIPSEEYLGVYRYNAKISELNEAELKSFTDSVLPKLADSLGIELPQYEIEKSDYGLSADFLEGSAGADAYYMFVTQRNSWQSFDMRGSLKYDRKIILDGETVKIDQRMSDEEIKTSLQSIKAKLFDIFGVSFSDTKIVRYFDSYSEYGAKFVDIYFYNESDHPLNSVQNKPISDCICIRFDNTANWDGDIVSDSILSVSDIDYVRTRGDISERYALTGNAKLISLEEAEALLYKGYIFGGHTCALCMAEQEKISFEGYDFVDIAYCFGVDGLTGDQTLGIPFYAFYKKTGTSRNGNNIYARTYVAAIEVSGYDEYFAAQEKHHQTIKEDVTAEEFTE